LADELTAERAARLAKIAEEHKNGELEPVYVIGTEVPVPGGALEELEDELEVTSPEATLKTYQVHKSAFKALNLRDAFSRVVGMVVQPGVEFGHSDMIHYDPQKSKKLTAALKKLPNIVFEAHSTDYQTPEALAALVENGFSILKVGPWLTFALREGLYGLDNVADAVQGKTPQGRLMSAMEDTMQSSPENWEKYYTGNETELWIQRHFSFSDRIRYYWPDIAAQEAVEKLKARLNDVAVPTPVLKQYLNNIEHHSDMDGTLVECVKSVITIYDSAIS